MTNSNKHKRVARERMQRTGEKYTQALRGVKQAQEFEEKHGYRPGIDEQLGELVRHPLIQMMERPDGTGYMNGSLGADDIRSFIPLMDRVVDLSSLGSVKWVLGNDGPNWNQLCLIKKSGMVMADGNPVYCEPAYLYEEDQELSLEMLVEAKSFDDIEGFPTGTKLDDIVVISFFGMSSNMDPDETQRWEKLVRAHHGKWEEICESRGIGHLLIPSDDYRASTFLLDGRGSTREQFVDAWVEMMRSIALNYEQDTK